ncbi:cupin domain-containing protein [Nocardia asiatica]|uniref:cupin domain-containing protein n=1 Tax=Nocardia asiatica TaxID=209252 RepID=UPI0024538FCE|nr:cupin domain-containing protein [Nocardia asiatica]
MTWSPVRSGDNAHRAIRHLGALIEFDATTEQTGGALAVTRHTCRLGTAAPLHRHDNEDEVFVVLNGELSVHIAGRWFRLPAGTTLFAPRGVPHAYRVESQVCQFLTVITPGGFERWFTATGTPAETLTLPPAPPGPPDFALLVTAAARHGVDILGPTPH